LAGWCKGSLVVVDADDGSTLHDPIALAPTALCFDTSGRWLAAAGVERVEEVQEFEWAVATEGEVPDQLEIPGRSDRVIATTEDGQLVATAGEKGRVRVWSAATGETLWEIPRSEFPGHFSWEVGCRFHPEGDRILLWDRIYAHLFGLEGRRMQPLGTRRRPLGKNTDTVCRFLADGRVLAGVRMDCVPAEPVTLDFDDPGEVQLEGDPSKLRREWEARLGLRIQDGRIVPR